MQMAIPAGKRQRSCRLLQAWAPESTSNQPRVWRYSTAGFPSSFTLATGNLSGAEHSGNLPAQSAMGLLHEGFDSRSCARRTIPREVPQTRAWGQRFSFVPRILLLLVFPHSGRSLAGSMAALEDCALDPASPAELLLDHRNHAHAFPSPALHFAATYPRSRTSPLLSQLCSLSSGKK